MAGEEAHVREAVQSLRGLLDDAVDGHLLQRDSKGIILFIIITVGSKFSPGAGPPITKIIKDFSGHPPRDLHDGPDLHLQLRAGGGNLHPGRGGQPGSRGPHGFAAWELHNPAPPVGPDHDSETLPVVIPGHDHDEPAGGGVHPEGAELGEGAKNTVLAGPAAPGGRRRRRRGGPSTRLCLFLDRLSSLRRDLGRGGALGRDHGVVGDRELLQGGKGMNRWTRWGGGVPFFLGLVWDGKIMRNSTATWTSCQGKPQKIGPTQCVLCFGASG
jgi:hypothetical protein